MIATRVLPPLLGLAALLGGLWIGACSVCGDEVEEPEPGEFRLVPHEDDISGIVDGSLTITDDERVVLEVERDGLRWRIEYAVVGREFQ